MSRNPKNRQVNVPIERDSEVEAFYEQEAADAGLGGKLPTYIALLLIDRYRALTGQEYQSLWFPRGWTAGSTPVIQSNEDTTRSAADVEDMLAAFGGMDDDEEDD